MVVVAVELPRVRWNLLVVSVYLQVDTGIHLEPNSTILASLATLFSAHKNFLVIGDWNVPFCDMEATTFAAKVKGEFTTNGQSTVTSGNILDYCLVSRSVSGITGIETDWEVPFGTHAAIHCTCDVGAGKLLVPQLKGYPNVLLKEHGSLEAAPEEPPVVPGNIAGVELGDDPLTKEFALFSARAESVCFNAPKGWGVTNPVQCKPPMQKCTSRHWHGTQPAKWNKHLTELKLNSLDPQLHADGLLLWEGQDAEAWTAAFQCMDQAAALQLAEGQLEAAAKQAREACADSYKNWLELASQGSLRPLFRSLKTQETVTMRPFRDKEFASRMVCRMMQWAPLWQAKSTPLEIKAELKERAVAQAMALPPITGQQLFKRFRSMPVKAPGPDGWDVPSISRTFGDARRAMGLRSPKA